MSLERAGMAWDEEEIKRLLSGIYRKRSLKELAAEHKRSFTALKAQLKKMAADYWFHDWRTVDQIMVYTGLTKREVEAAIKHKYASYSVPQENNVVSEIAELKQEILTMRQDMKEILALMKGIYNFEMQ